MSLGFIAALKELQPVAYQPLMLAEIAFYNQGSPSVETLYLSSHMLSGTAEGGGGFPYNGHDYLPRLLNTDVSATQAMSDLGIDSVPSVSLTINDPDGTIWSGFENPIGFKGAVMTIRFIFWNADTADFSTDSVVKFVGTCQRPEVPDEATIKVTAVSKLQSNQTMLPSLHVQQTCPWLFPITAAQRQSSADSDVDPSFECGYSPDAMGGNQVGNFQASTTQSGSITSTGLSLTVGSITGSLPSTPFVASVGGEAVVVVGVAGSTWTLSTRGAQGTTAASHSSAAIKVVYSSCSRTRSDCMLRLGNPAGTSVAPDGDITHDTSTRHTGRFGGIQYQPPATTTARPYITSKWELILNTSNQAKYGDLIPLAYGTTWTNALVLNVVGDGNYTKMEVLICYGQIPFIYDVVVNGAKIPHTYNDGIMTGVPAEIFNNSNSSTAGGWWVAINDGSRNGNLDADLPYNKLGDCYGSLAVIEIVVPASLASSSSIPSVQILHDGPTVRVYTAPTTFTKTYSSNPAWVMLDVLVWAGWKVTDLDIPSFIAAAAKYNEQISFTSQSGGVLNSYTSMRPGAGTIPYTKFDTSLSVRSRTTAADLLRGLRNSCGSLLLPNYDNGLLQLLPKETIATQQSTLPTLNGQTATNYTTPIPSITTDGVLGNGFVAYSFDESNIANKDDRRGSPSTFRILPQTLSDSPNSISIPFEDFENKYNVDSLTLDDTEDQLRINSQPIVGSPAMSGLNSFDRARRMAALYMAEINRGNPRNALDGETLGDTGGTIKIEFETSFRAIHLHVGHIIQVSYQQRGITNWFFRVTAVQPAMNATRIKIQAAYHNDGWYLNTYGQIGAPLYRLPQGNNRRPPYNWSPNAEQPQPGDSMFRRSEFNFALAQQYSVATDNTAIMKVVVSGAQPINIAASSPQPPIITLQATTATTGGSIPGGRTYFFQVSSKDVTGSAYKPSYPSFITAQVFVPGGTNTNTITINVSFWDSAAVGYVVFGGTTPQRLTYQKDADATPSTITLTSYNEASWGVPDGTEDHVALLKKRAFHCGVAGTTVVSCTSTTLTLSVNTSAGFGMGINQFANYDVSLMALVTGANSKIPSSANLPIWNAKIASNTADTLTFTAGLDGVVPDPTSIPRGDGTNGLVAGDVVTIRSVPTAGVDSGGLYIQDLNWSNCFGELFPAVAVSAVTNANPGVVTTAIAHGYTTGDLVFLDDMNGMSGFPQLVTVTVTGTTTFSIGIDTTSSGIYAGGGIAQKQEQGLAPGGEVGNQILMISGTGRWFVFNIIANTINKIYVAGTAWPNGAVPDSTTRYLVVESMWEPETDTVSAINNNYGATLQMAPGSDNYDMVGMVVLTLTASANGQQSLLSGSPIRDYFVLGNPGDLSTFENGNVTLNGVPVVI